MYYHNRYVFVLSLSFKITFYIIFISFYYLFYFYIQYYLLKYYIFIYIKKKNLHFFYGGSVIYTYYIDNKSKVFILLLLLSI